MSAVLKVSDFADVAPQRYNIYTIIHKALRGFMVDTLLRWGRVDVTDAESLRGAVDQARSLLTMCTEHLQHENDFIHPALESARAGAAAKTRHDHVDHVNGIASLHAEVTALETANQAQRARLAYRLYQRLSTFVAENFEHMLIEETANHQTLIDAYSDAEILEINHRIVASLTPEQAFVDLRWMFSHINNAELAYMLGGMKRNAPAPVFNAALDLAREVLNQRDFSKLELALA